MMSSSKAVNARGESGFTLIDMLFVIALIALLSTLAIPGLMRAKGAAQSASAIGSLKVVNSAQLSFAITCGLGFYAPDLKTLGKKPPKALDAFLPPEMSSGLTFIKSGYEFSLAGTGISGAPGSCNGLAVGAASSGYAALLVSTLPLWTTTLEAFLDRRPPTLRLVGSLVIGMAGIVVLNFPVIRHGSHADLVACLLLLLAVFSWGIGSVMQKRRPVTVSAEVNSGYQLLFGAFFLLLAAWLTGEPRPHPTTEAWLAWGYLVVFGSVIAFTSFVKALQLLPVHVVATYAYVNPVIALLLGWLILGERITSWTVAGSLLVLLGVAGVFSDQRRRATARVK